MYGLWYGVEEEEDNFVYVLVFMIYIKSLCKMSRVCAGSGRQTEALPRQTLARGDPA